MTAQNFPFDEKPSLRKKTSPFLTVENTVAIYTTLKILSEIRTQLGLEVMLEYMGAYLLLIEKTAPMLKGAVGEAINLVSIEKLYKDMLNNETIR